MKQETGRCRLCLASPVKLLRSHIMPRWVYTRARDTSKTNPNPVFVDRGHAVQTSQQITEYLLCQNCEQRFSVDEKYASKVAYQDDGSADFLFSQLVRDESAEPEMPVSAFAPTLDLTSLVRFAASVLWRAHVSTQVDGCRLGDKYGEAFRRYLLREAEFPQHASVVLHVFEDVPNTRRSHMSRSSMFPYSLRQGARTFHTVLACGLSFEFAVGRIPDTDYRSLCLVRGPADRRVILAAPNQLRRHLGGMMMKRARRVSTRAP